MQDLLPPRRAHIPVFTMGDRLRKAREDAEISVGEMADRLHRHRNSIGHYERSTFVDELVLRAYAMETGTSYVWLSTGYVPEGGDPVTARVTLGYPLDVSVSFGEWLTGHRGYPSPDQLQIPFAA